MPNATKLFPIAFPIQSILRLISSSVTGQFSFCRGKFKVNERKKKQHLVCQSKCELPGKMEETAVCRGFQLL